MLRTFLAIAASLFFVAGAAAHSVDAGALSLTDLWTRATPPKAPTAGGYMTIANKGKEADRLIAATSPLADKAVLHRMEVVDGVMKMHPVEGGIEIPAGATVTLAPGGLHIMFVGMKEPLTEGGKLPLTLIFEKAGKVETFLHVHAIGADAPGGGHDHGDMKMDVNQ